MKVINFYIVLLTFIPFIPIYFITMVRGLNRNKEAFSWKYLRKHLVEIFRIDLLILIIFFFFFASFKYEFINKYLFPVMCLYLFANSFYEKNNKLPKNFWKDNFINLILLFMIMFIPFIFYFLTNRLDITYEIMLLMLFFEYFIVEIVNKIGSFIKILNKNH